jgi:hypothetical protein
MPERSEVAVVLDWSAAEVRGAQLVVPYAEKLSKRWVQEAASVLERLGTGERSVTVGSETVEVDDVTPGGVEDVHHLLESVVVEVNARLAPDEPEQDAPSEEDAEMTAAFRGFGS